VSHKSYIFEYLNNQILYSEVYFYFLMKDLTKTVIVTVKYTVTNSKS